MHFFDCRGDGVSDESSDGGDGKRKESSSEGGPLVKGPNDEGVLGEVVRP